MLLVAECSWASSMVGAGLDFAVVTGISDPEGLSLLRGLQRKIGDIRRAKRLFLSGGRAPSADEISERGTLGGKVTSRAGRPALPPGL